jgi:cytoskeletal protein RodZ
VSAQNSRQPPWEEDQSREAASFGAWLRSQRKIREVPLGEIADATKISVRYLEALEQDRFDVLPASVFAKGFLREYARFVGLDPDEVVNSYLTAQQASLNPELDEVTAERTKSSPRERKNTLLLVLALVVALALIAFLIYWGGTQSRGEAVTPAIAAPVLPPPPSLPVDESAEPGAALVVTMDFTEDCWVEASVDGRRRISELHVQGESMRLEADEEVHLTLGNSQGVRLEVNGEPYPLPSLDGQVARDLVINRQDLAAEVVSP